MANNWDDKFASYNFDNFDMPPLSKPQTESSETVDPPTESTEETDAAKTLPENAETLTAESLIENTEAADDTEAEEKDEGKEMEEEMAASMAVMEEKRKQSEEKRKELKDRFPRQPKQEDPLAPAMEVLKTAEDLGLLAATIDSLKRMVGQVVESGVKPPKGVKSALRRMDDFIKVAQGAQVVVEAVANTGLPEVFETLKSSRFLSVYKSVKLNRERKEPKVLTTITELTTALEEGDKEEATAIARQLKQHAMRIQDDARSLANALFEATSNYPDENGQLGLFAQIAEGGDTKGMENIDHAMHLTGKVVVPVGEAKAMLEARANGDQQTIDDILDRVITKLVEEEN